MIQIEGISIGYNHKPLMSGVSLHIKHGEFWGIVGPNGGGKTTLVRTMLGLIPPVSGEVHFEDRKPRFGYVPQRHSLNVNYPLTVWDVALMGRTDQIGLGRRPKDADRERTRAELERIGMLAMKDLRFGALSGGQKQRVLMARALASDPNVLVLDEPTTGMDLPGESDILTFLTQLHTESHMTIVMIGHHIEKVASVVDHLCLISKDANRFEVGELEELMDSERLSALYEREINIAELEHGHHITVGEATR